MTEKLTVHDPRGYPPKVTGKRLAPRLESFDGKIVYLVDCLFDNSDVFMQQLEQWFAAAASWRQDPADQTARELGRRPRDARRDRSQRRRCNTRCRTLKHL